MVVSAAVNCAAANASVQEWLAEHRRKQTDSIIARLELGVRDGEMIAETDSQALGDYYSALLHGLSVQARDGVSRERLLALIPTATAAIKE